MSRCEPHDLEVDECQDCLRERVGVLEGQLARAMSAQGHLQHMADSLRDGSDLLEEPEAIAYCRSAANAYRYAAELLHLALK